MPIPSIKTVLLGLFLLLPCSLSAQWITYPTGSERELSDIRMVTSSIAYIGGIDGIYKSTDGGASWTLLPYFQSTLETIDSLYFLTMNDHHLFFIDEFTGFSAGWSALQNEEMIIKTTDGGNTWTIQHFDFYLGDGISFGLTDLQFVNAKVGMTVGYKGRFLKTTDAGQSWQSRPTGTNRHLESLQFLDEMTGFAAGEGIFLSTRDGGESWTPTALPHHIKDIHFFDASNGLAVTTQGIILISSDAGRNWTPHPMRQEQWYQKIFFVDQHTGYIAGNSSKGRILKTVDGGKHWYQDLQLEDSGVSALFFLDKTNGMAATASGKILTTSNGGANTSFVPLFTSFSPSEGKIGTEVSILGEHMQEVVAVEFGGQANASFTYKSNTELRAKVPAGATDGKIKLVYKNGEVLSASAFTLLNIPVILEVPELHPIGEPLYIRGGNLQQITKVYFGNLSVPFIIKDAATIEIPLAEGMQPSEDSRSWVFEYSGTKIYTGNTRLVGKPRILSINVHPINDPKTPYRTFASGTTYLYGYDLALVEGLYLGDVAIPFTITDNRTIQFSAPAGLPEAFLEVRGRSGAARSKYPLLVLDDPVIYKVEPATARTGEQVVVYGKNLFRHPHSYGPNNIPSTAELLNDTTFTYPLPNRTGTHDIAYTWPQRGITSNKIPYTITEYPPMGITKMSPDTAAIGGSVEIRGYFGNKRDSIFIGQTRLMSWSSLHNIIRFTIPATATSSHIRIYTDRGLVESEKPLIISATPPPHVNRMEPAVATEGSRVKLEGQYLREIEQISLNGLVVPFTIISQVTAYIFLPRGVSTGALVLKGKYGSTQTDTELIISDKAKAIPVIDYLYQTPSGGLAGLDLIKLVGNNFSQITGVWVDEYAVEEFRIISDDTLALRVPYFPKNRNDSGKAEIIVESPYGMASIWVSYIAYKTRKITRVNTYRAVRTATVEVELEPLDPQTQYFSVNTFLFNGIPAKKVIKLSDTKYLLSVPETGDVTGRIGVTFVATSHINWTQESFMLEEGYCQASSLVYLNKNLEAADKPTLSFVRFQLGDRSYDSGGDCRAYSDYLSAPIELKAGQSYPMQFKLATCDQPDLYVSSGGAVKVLIDFNADGDFYDEGEVVLSLPSVPHSSLVSYLLKIPDGVPLNKPLRLRILTGLYTKTHEVEACGFTKWGEVEDHLLVFREHAPALAVDTFYPKEANVNSVVVVNGSYLDQAEQVVVGGAAASFSSLNTNTLLVHIPQEATNGKIEVVAGNQRAALEETFTLNTAYTHSITQPGQTNYSFANNKNPADPVLYAFLGKNSVPVWEEPWNAETLIIPIFPGTYSNETFCLYNKGGGACTASPVVLLPQINKIEPEAGGYVGERITLYGRYFHQISAVSFNGTATTDFEVIGDDIILVTVPAGATTGKVSITSPNGTGAPYWSYTIHADYCYEDRKATSWDYIQEMQFGNYYFSQGQAPGRSHIVHTKEIPVLPGMTYGYGIKTSTKKFVANRRWVDWNTNLVFETGHSKEEVSFEGLSGNVRIPLNMPAGSLLRVRIMAHIEYAGPIKPCDSWGQGEIHDFTLLVIDPFTPRLLSTTQNPCINEPVQFMVSNLNEDPSFTYLWDFGDGSTSQAPKPEHRYQRAGNYQITLLVREGNKEILSSAMELSIGAAPAAVVIQASALEACSGETVLLTAPSGYSAYEWSDGTTSEAWITNQPGEYSVRVMNQQGCWSAFSEAVKVTFLPSPEAHIEYKDGFLHASSGNYYNWFKDNEPLPYHESKIVYPGPGMYRVEVILENGCNKLSEPYHFEIVGIANEVATSDITLYPNPASDLLFIQTHLPLRISKIVLYSPQMQKLGIITPSQDPSAQTVISIKHLMPGLYLMKISTHDDQTIIKRFLVQ
jgi:hypothetical protein